MTTIVRACGAMVLAMLLGLASTGAARAEEPYGPRLIQLSIVDRDTGAEKRVYYYDRRYFIAGESGHRYSLRIRNLTGERLLAVLSVDGVNVVSGDTADYNGSGYILAPHESADINGWRKSQYEVAAFEFAPLSQSYAARTGRPGNVGIIGMAVFREKRRPPRPVYRATRRDGALPAPPPPSPAGAAADQRSEAAPATVPTERLGTGHGQIEQDFSAVASFERASTVPAAVRMVEYDSPNTLIAAGIIPEPAPVPHRPHPFPGHRGEPGFVPDPPPMGRPEAP